MSEEGVASYPETIPAFHFIASFIASDRLYKNLIPTEAFLKLFDNLSNQGYRMGNVAKAIDTMLNHYRTFIFNDPNFPLFTDKLRLLYNYNSPSLAEIILKHREELGEDFLRNIRVDLNTNYQRRDRLDAGYVPPHTIRFGSDISDTFLDAKMLSSFKRMYDNEIPLGEYYGRQYTSRDLAIDIASYTFQVSDINNPTSLIKYIPVDFLEQMGVLAFIRDKQTEIFLDDIDSELDPSLTTFARQFLLNNTQHIPVRKNSKRYPISEHGDGSITVTSSGVLSSDDNRLIMYEDTVYEPIMNSGQVFADEQGRPMNTRKFRPVARRGDSRLLSYSYDNRPTVISSDAAIVEQYKGRKASTPQQIKTILNNIAKETPNSQLAKIATELSRLSDEVIGDVVKQVIMLPSGDSRPARYFYESKIIGINASVAEGSEVGREAFVEEMMHALQFNAISNPTEDQKPIVESLENLRKELIKKYGKQYKTAMDKIIRLDRGENVTITPEDKVMYALSNLYEFTAAGYHDKNFVKFLRNEEYKGSGTSLWKRFTTLLTRLLNRFLGNETLTNYFRDTISLIQEDKRPLSPVSEEYLDPFLNLAVGDETFSLDSQEKVDGETKVYIEEGFRVKYNDKNYIVYHVKEDGSLMLFDPKTQEKVNASADNVTPLSNTPLDTIVDEDGIFIKLNNEYKMSIGAKGAEVFKYADRSRSRMIGGFYLNDQQNDAVDEANLMIAGETSYDDMVITGAAGTGKTTIALAIINENPKAKFVVSGFSHAVTKNIQKKTGAPAYTVSALTGKAPDKDGVFDYRNPPKFIEADVLIIDETSALNNSDYDFIKENFPGKIIFLGDAAQLKAVENREGAKAFDNAGKTIELTEIVRQQGRVGDRINVIRGNSLATNPNVHPVAPDGDFTSFYEDGEGIIFINSNDREQSQKATDYVIEQFRENVYSSKIIGATNQFIYEQLNPYIANVLIEGFYEVGHLIRINTNVYKGPVLTIPNGLEGKIIESKDVSERDAFLGN